MKMFIFSKVAGFQLATLPKMNFILGIFKDFDRKFQNTYFPEHLSVAVLWYPFYPNVVFYVETTQFMYSTDQLTGFYTKDYIWIGNVEAF